jgi:hypothetical protein
MSVVMNLLELSLNDDFSLVPFDDDKLPRYAILSHTWIKDEEVTYNEVKAGTGKGKSGYDKLRFCGKRAAQDGLQYFWVDTCCIDKSDYQKLQTALNHMFRYYQRASKCYVYLCDVQIPDEIVDVEAFSVIQAEAFRRSRWFTRGWTLQELLAPPEVEFFSKEGKRFGNKISLEQEIYDITKIPIQVLKDKVFPRLVLGSD